MSVMNEFVCRQKVEFVLMSRWIQFSSLNCTTNVDGSRNLGHKSFFDSSTSKATVFNCTKIKVQLNTKLLQNGAENGAQLAGRSAKTSGFENI